jgi:hypothetical protein
MIRKAIRSIMPVSIRHRVLNYEKILHHALEARKNRHKTTAEIFSEIYEKNKWGGLARLALAQDHLALPQIST